MDEEGTYRRSAERLRDREQKQVRLTLDGWATITLTDLQQFREQAMGEAATYAKRDRPTIERTFAGLAALANFELTDRVSGDQPAVWLTLETMLDETSGAEANKDDLAIIILRVVAMIDEPGTRDGTRNLWARVMAEIMRNRDRLTTLGLSM